MIAIDRDFEKNSIVLLSLTLVASIANYIFQIFMGRMLDINQFGTLNALFSLNTVVSVPVSAILMIVAKYISEFNAIGESDEPLLKRFFIIISALALCFIAFGVGLSGTISSFLNLGGNGYIVFIIFSSGLGLILPVATGGLQGRKRFFALGVVNLIVPLTKLFGSLFFLLIGLDIFGVLLSVLLGNFLSILLGLCLLKINLKPSAKKTGFVMNFDALRFMGLSVLVNAGLIILTNIDILLVKHLFSAEETGIYSTASILCKTILFISGSFVTVMFPMIADAAARKSDVNRYLTKALLFGGGLSLICAAVLCIFPKLAINILFGSKYLASADLVFPVSLWIIAVSFLTILANYSLAVNRAKILSISLSFGCLTSIILVLLLHISIMQIIYIFAAMSFAVLLISYIPIAIKMKKDSSFNNS